MKYIPVILEIRSEKSQIRRKIPEIHVIRRETFEIYPENLEVRPEIP